MTTRQLTQASAIAALVLGIGWARTPSAHANFQVFMTPPGAATPGGPIAAEADFTTSGTGTGGPTDTIQIVLRNLQANPRDIGQALSNLGFSYFVPGKGSLLVMDLASSSSREVEIFTNGTYALGNTVPTGWALNPPSTTIPGALSTLDVLGTPTAPRHLLIGGPNPATNTYSDANTSIAGETNNPFLSETAAFTVFVPGMTPDGVITNVSFSFGTTPGIIVPAGASVVPEPASMILMVTGLASIGLVQRLLRRAAGGPDKRGGSGVSGMVLS